ncbi:short chain dehydrogenase/reductase family [Verticillium dahliae]|nr:short chain dehydrogenase/reductase family [Verticillium dahliae]
MESPATLQAGNLFSVTGLIAVVTGGGTGIGLLITKALVANGATVYILGRRGDVLRQAAQSIGVEAVKPVICDVTSKASLTSAVNVISADTGYINLLICNAGISGPQTHLPSSEHQISVEDFSRVNMDVSIEDYTRTFRANVVATWYTTMAFLRLLDAGNRKGNVRQKSQVVAITSIAAFNKVNTAGFAYSQSKAACTHLMKNLAVALPRWEIRANMICPGRQYFELSSSFVIHYRGGIGRDMVPLERVGNEEDMAGAVLYLASRAGAYCNGSIIMTDGGRLGNFASTF